MDLRIAEQPWTLLFGDLHKLIFREVEIRDFVFIIGGNSSVVVQRFHYLLSCAQQDRGIFGEMSKEK